MNDIFFPTEPKMASVVQHVEGDEKKPWGLVDWACPEVFNTIPQKVGYQVLVVFVWIYWYAW